MPDKHAMDHELLDKRKLDPERRTAVIPIFAHINPRCASIMVRAMDSPIPMPSVLLV